MFKPMLLATMVAGILAGFLFAVAQQILTVPLIMEAEMYEDSALALLSEEDPLVAMANDEQEVVVNTTSEAINNDAVADDNLPDKSASPTVDEAVSERTLYTWAGSVLTSLILAFLLTAAMVLYGKGNSRTGILWGIAGYLAFFVAPSLGLVPKLPSAVTVALEHRQLWWVSTVLATGSGLALLMLAKPMALKGVGLLLLILPHIVGAPLSDQQSLAPETLSQAFIWMSAIANFILWVALGVLIGWLLNKLQVINGKVWD